MALFNYKWASSWSQNFHLLQCFPDILGNHLRHFINIRTLVPISELLNQALGGWLALPGHCSLLPLPHPHPQTPTPALLLLPFQKRSFPWQEVTCFWLSVFNKPPQNLFLKFKACVLTLELVDSFVQTLITPWTSFESKRIKQLWIVPLPLPKHGSTSRNYISQKRSHI